MSRPKDSANNIQSRRTKTPTALIIHSAARSIVAFRLSSKNRPQRYRSYGSALFWLKDESLEDSANLPLHCHPEFPASLDTLKVSVPPAVKLAPLPALDPDIIAAEIVEDRQLN